MTMKTSRWRNRRGFLSASATVAAVLAAAFAGLAAPALATASHPALRAGTAHRGRGPGYPPPGGIYAPFTNCPLNNPIMHEDAQTASTGGFSAAACSVGEATSGTIKLGNITTQVTEPVNVQFGFYTQPGWTTYPAPAPPPLDGISAELSTKPDLIPESLTTALGCSTATNATIEHMCQVAQARGGRFNQVYALAEEVAPITNFQLFKWTQSVMFQLINPLLGYNCSIGTPYNPVVLNPSLSVGPGGSLTQETDPDPTLHPDTFVLDINGAVASDTTFSAPGVSGCGPGGLANVPVDEALNASSGLPAASGSDSLSLNGTFELAVNEASEDSSLTQPQDDAADLLAAFRASSRHGGDGVSVTHQITMSQLNSMLHSKG
jgi:hypothetical protein